ncbi:MAG: HAMP domain-containing protein [Rhodocyclales bacterium]|nr:HAMP domain-containing protein [Rhodocyclales bacterium]
MPRTLLVRTFLLVSLLIVVNVGIWATLFGLATREPKARHLAQLTASAVNLTRAALVAAAPAKRRGLLYELSEREGIHLVPAEPDDRIARLPDDAFHALFRTETLRLLGTGTLLASAVNGEEGIWASFQLDDAADDLYWVMLPLERAERAFPWHWLGWGIASVVLALFVAWLIVSRVTQPLRALAHAAREVGHGRQPEPVTVAGADELRQLARAFNQMADDLARIEHERAEVLAGISHDLRTPLARLRLEAELSVADEAARDAIAADIEQMDEIIAQFLDYARADAEEAPQPTSPAQLLEEIAARYERSGMPVAVAEAPTAPVPLRPLAVRRALGNLVDNARKYAGGEITLAAAIADGMLRFDVLDRGPGIPEAEIDRMKRPFTRLENARTDASGTGLGLAIVERVARLHGGRFTLAARAGGGLAASLRIPLDKAG